MITTSDFIEELRSRMGAASESEARRTLAAALLTMGECLPRTVVALVAAELPPEMGARLEQGLHGTPLTRSELYGRVAARAQLRRGFAHEHTQAVCRALVSRLSSPAAEALRSSLPAQLFEPSLQDRLEPTMASHRSATLATGAPGSQHPLSEAHPREGQAHSVVCEANPHGERKVSSATPARETLATSPASSRHPVSESKPRR